GILLGTGRELEIAKQLFDTSTLTDYISDFNLLTETYANSALEETEFRGGSWSRDDILKDTIRACKSIISRGAFDGDDYLEYLRGIKSLGNHILLKGYNTDDATWRACKVIYLASCLLSGNPYRKIESPEEYLTARLQGNDFKKLSYIKKQNAESYAYLVEATRNLK
ncbi:MAG: hypothetical protein J6T65_08140, partial [Clostridia bacterium]|nr:hypothetical protein [Clostridia bacterium]